MPKKSTHTPTAQPNTTKHSFAPLEHLFLNNNSALVLCTEGWPAHISESLMGLEIAAPV